MNDTQNRTPDPTKPELSGTDFFLSDGGSREALRVLMDTIPDLVTFKDGQGRWLDANATAVRFFRLDHIDFKGKTNTELARMIPSHKQTFSSCEEYDSKAWEHGRRFRQKRSVPMPDQTEKIMDCIIYPLFYKDGTRKGLLTIGRDVTEQEKTRENLENLRRHQNVINRLQSIALSSDSLKKQLEMALEEIYSLPWLPLQPKGAVFLKSEKEPDMLDLVACRNLDPDEIRLCSKVPYGWCLCGKVAESKEIMFSRGTDDRHDGGTAGISDHGHYIVPVTRDNDLLGVVCLYLAPGHQESETEYEFLSTLVEPIAVMIEHNYAEQALRESESSLARTKQMARVGHWEWDPDTDDLYFSDEVCDILGLDQCDMAFTRTGFVDMIHPDDRDLVRDRESLVLREKRPVSVEYRLQRPDGTERILLEQMERITSEPNGTIRISGMVQDVTFIKRSQEELLLAAKVFETSMEGITITDSNGKIQMVNSAFTDITGYTAKEAIGKNPRILKSDRHDHKFYSDMWESLVRTGQWQGEIWNRRKSGEVYPEWLSITAVKDNNGQTVNYVAVFHDMSELKEKEAQVHHHLYNDPLTGLPNKTLFMDRLSVIIDKTRENRTPVAVMILDLDNFKHVNDTYGHSFGDILLQMVAKRLASGVRKEDTMARESGDEFLFLLNRLSRQETSADVAMRVMELMEKPFHIRGEDVYLTCSIGISLFPADGREPEELVKNADIAMHRTKEMGKNSYQLFTSTMNDRVRKRMLLENSLRKALNRDEFIVYYQPKVSLSTGKITGMEALVRWKREDGFLVSPVEFIPVAEETGIIVEIGERVLKDACLTAKQLNDEGHDFKVSVNLSPKQFRHTRLLDQIMQTLSASGLSPGSLELEITEGTVMEDERTAINLLKALKKKGVFLSIDDFGTGYSSLQYMKQLPIDIIKIDRSFIKDIPDSENDMAITSGAISMAHALHLKVIAEGVETEEQVKFLRELNCESYQGYLCSPPVPAREFKKLLPDWT